MFYGSFPLIAMPGDIYVNAKGIPYLFTTRDNCEMLSWEILNQWVKRGVMQTPRTSTNPAQQFFPVQWEITQQDVKDLFVSGRWEV